MANNYTILDGFGSPIAFRSIETANGHIVFHVLTDVTGAAVGTPTNPLPVADGFSVASYDYIENSYSNTNLLVQTVYKRGGANGTIVATLTMTYDANNNLSTATKS